MKVCLGSKKQLACVLSRLASFENPNVQLEQYMTDSETAADVLWNAYLNGDVLDKTVLDLGCGTGILGIGALLLGAKHVTFVDLDKAALEIAKVNISSMESESSLEGTHDIVCSDIITLSQKVHLVLENPPFGTRDEGADIAFIKKSKELGTITYTFHKTSTKEFVDNAVLGLGGNVTHVWSYRMPIKATYSHHTKKLQRVEVSVWRIAWTKEA